MDLTEEQHMRFRDVRAGLRLTQDEARAECARIIAEALAMQD